MVNNIVQELDNSRVFHRDQDINIKLEGSLAEAVRFIERNQICEVGLWKKFVNVFREQTDGDKGRWIRWRSEFWGKMMRGACFTYSLTKSKELYGVLEQSVKDMLSTANGGRIFGTGGFSYYPAGRRPQRWRLPH